MSLSPVLALALGAPVAVAPAGANPNLLLWTEEFDNAVWAKTNCTVRVSEAVDPGGAATADAMASTAPEAALRQTTDVAAVAGDAVTQAVAFTTSYVRGSVTGTFDGQQYTFSIYVRDTGLALDPSITLRLDRAGGFLRCSIEDPVGDGDYVLAWAQLEAAGAATTYTYRGGA